MQLITKHLPDDHNIFLFGDLHDSSVLSFTAGWNELCDMMCSEYEGCSSNYGAEGGDMIEAIMTDDRRSDAQKLKEVFPLAQIREAKRKREPIKHMMLYLLDGNHEEKLWRFGNITEEIADHLGVDYGTYSCKLTVKTKDDKLMYKISDTHDSRNISSTADDPLRQETNMNLILKRQLREKFGDCAVQIKHHCHKLLVCPPLTKLYMVDNGKKIQQRYTHWGQTENYIHPDARWYGSAGSFLRLYGDGISGYAEKFGYDPVQLGFLVLIVRDRKIVELKKHVLGLK